MEHLIADISWLQDKSWLRGYSFGLIHTLIPLIGFYTGWSINRLVKVASNGYVAGILGVIIAHVVADFIAATLDPHIQFAAMGIVLGGLTPLLIIPVLEKYVTKSRHHMVAGDHEDVKRDFEQTHK